MQQSSLSGHFQNILEHSRLKEAMPVAGPITSALLCGVGGTAQRSQLAICKAT
jgi:hypothetical protein